MKTAYCLLISIVITIPVYGQESFERRFTDEEWAEDIRTYVELLNETHIAPFHSVSEQEFNQAVESLVTNLSGMSDFDIALELLAIAALIGDGHTWTWFSDDFNPRRLPLGLGELSDGVFVASALPELEELVGRRVVTINGYPTESLLEKPYRFMSRDNEYGLLNSRVYWLTNEAFLRYEGIVKEIGAVKIGFEPCDGKPDKVEVDFVDRLEYRDVKDKPSAAPEKLPLYLERADETYWMEYLKKPKTLFVQINAIQNADDGPRFGQLAREIIKVVEEEKAKKLVIDLRHNGGGNGDLTTNFIRAIARNERINQPGRLFVITSPTTFSAALMFVVRMERATHALFAGVPGAGKPNSYGEFNAFTLPNSDMHGSISSRWHEEGEPDDQREFVPVDIPVTVSSKDYFTGHDPVLDAIIASKN